MNQLKQFKVYIIFYYFIPLVLEFSSSLLQNSGRRLRVSVVDICLAEKIIRGDLGCLGAD